MKKLRNENKQSADHYWRWQEMAKKDIVREKCYQEKQEDSGKT